MAVLLGMLVWTQMAVQPYFVASAHAQIRSKPAGTARDSGSHADPRHATEGVSSVGRRSIQQRDQIIAAITALQTSVDRLAAKLASGDVQVQLADQADTGRSHAEEGDAK